MALKPISAMVRKDLMVFLSDRRAVITSFVVPIAIASFFASITAGAGRTEPARVDVLVVDQDQSPISQAIVAGARGDKNLIVTIAVLEDARDRVRRGQNAVAVVMPAGFGDAAGRAFYYGRGKPQLGFLYDPSHAMEVAMVRGVMTEHVMQAVSREMFTGERGRQLVDETLSQIGSLAIADEQKRLLREMLGAVQRYTASPASSTEREDRRAGLSMPYDVREEAVTARNNVPYNSFAHSFAGMGIQFLLFAATNLGIEMLVERQKGLWKRLRSAPVSRVTLLAGKAASATVIAMATLLVSFGFAMVVFRVRIQGSVIGFLAVALACSLMAATFGLLIAALGRTPGSARGVTILANLMMVMLGGAWVPTFVFPEWLQRATLIIPTRWAVDGLDAMTWRGIGRSGAVMPTVVLLAFAAAFGALALSRFRWEEA